MPDYPVNLRLRGLPVLVVGEGPVAEEKARGLREAEAVVTVVAPADYRPGDVGRAGYRLVVTAAGDPAVDQQLHDDAEAAGVFVNSADDPARCTFTLPAKVRRGDLVVAISTGGRSPALASWLRERLDDDLGPEYGVLLDLLAEERDRLRATGASSEVPGWKTALRSGMLDRVREGDLAGARELLRTCLSSSSG